MTIWAGLLPAWWRELALTSHANSGWGYDRIAGALANLGYVVSDQTVGNVLRRHGIAPAPQRSRTMSWKDFLAAHMNVLAGADFFTVEVLRWRGLVT
jgi:putative transposase